MSDIQMPGIKNVVADNVKDFTTTALPSEVQDFLEVSKGVSENNPIPAATIDGIFKNQPHILAGLRENGVAVMSGTKADVVLGAAFDTSGNLIATAAAVPRLPGRSEDFLSEVADFSSTSSNRAILLDLYENVYKREGVVNNAINKSAALVATEGQFKVRYVKGQRGVSGDTKAEELRQLLQFWVENVNARSEDGPVSGARGLKSFMSQGVRLALKQGDHFGRQIWTNVNVPILKGKSFNLPMGLQTFDAKTIEIPEGLEGTDIELFYWVPPREFIQTLEDPKDPNIKDQLDRLIPSDVRSALTSEGKYLLDPALMIHVKHRGTATTNYGECYSSDTEILTKSRGWVLFEDLQEGELVATRSNTGHFEWQMPTAYSSHNIDGEMYHLHSRSMDMLVTPNHRMLITGVSAPLGLSKGENEVFVTAEELHTHNSHHVKIPVTSSWKGQSISEVVLEPLNSNARTVIMSGDDYAAFMGAYLSEGNIAGFGGVEINQFPDNDAWELYNILFSKLGASYNTDNTTRGRFVLAKQAYADHVRSFGSHSYNKRVPDIIKNASVEQLQMFWDHYVAGDGCVQREDILNNPQVSITTTSRQMAGDLVEIAQKLGMSASVRIRPTGMRKVFDRECDCRETYTVRVRYSKAMAIHSTKVSYTGTVYCVQVPNQTLYVRRNGYPAWSGNSMIEPAMNEIAYKRALQALDMVTIENLVNRLVVVMIGSDDPTSIYHKQEVSSSRMKMMSNMLSRIGPSAIIVWPGPDIEIKEVGAFDGILDTDTRYQQVEERIKSALGVPSALLTGDTSGGKAAGWAAILGLAAELAEVQNQYKQAFKTIAERIALENGYEDVDVVWEFNQALLTNQENHVAMVIDALKAGAISFQTFLEELGFDFDAELIRMQEDVDNNRRDDLFSPPRAFTTQNNLGGESPEGEGGRPTNPNKKDPRKDKETTSPSENK